LGLVLLGLTLYISTLAYVLRDYSRSRLSERLGRNGSRRWLDWLDRHESELQVLTSFVRIAAVLGVVVFVYARYAGAAAFTAEPGTLVLPGLIALVLLLIFAIGIPHGLAAHVGEGVLARSLHVLVVLRTVLWPLARGLAGLDFVIRRLLGKAEGSEEDESELIEQEILAVVSEGEAHGAVDEDQKEII
jgi:CBS domain containing-hemolysin-like protein